MHKHNISFIHTLFHIDTLSSVWLGGRFVHAYLLHRDLRLPPRRNLKGFKWAMPISYGFVIHISSDYGYILSLQAYIQQEKSTVRIWFKQIPGFI